MGRGGGWQYGTCTLINTAQYITRMQGGSVINNDNQHRSYQQVHALKPNRHAECASCSGQFAGRFVKISGNVGLPVQCIPNTQRAYTRS